MNKAADYLADQLVGIEDAVDDMIAKGYDKDPVSFMTEILKIPRNTLVWGENPGYKNHTWDGTEEPLVAILEGLAAWKDVGVESATGTGKSYLAAAVILWFLACFRDARVVIAAPKGDQVTDYSWKEIRTMMESFNDTFPLARQFSRILRMDPKKKEAWTANAITVGVGSEEESATKAQGWHDVHMLIITEETPGIDKAVMEAFENTCTAPHNLRLALGNPDHSLDSLHKFCLSEGVVHIRISGLDHPNVVSKDPNIVPGAVSVESLAKRLRKYGEEGRMWLSRGRGMSPTEAQDSLVKMEWLLAQSQLSKAAREILRANGLSAIGADVANSVDGDKAATARGIGADCYEVPAFQCPDANKFGADLAAEIDERTLDPGRVTVDGVGVGAGCVNELKRLGKGIHNFNSGDRPVAHSGEERFFNLRAQAHWTLRVDLENGRIAIPYDEELFADLLAITWGTRGGKIFVEEKEKMKKRLGRSPNKADALVMWNWGRQHRARPSKVGFDFNA
jgi:hypothetical protein